MPKSKATYLVRHTLARRPDKKFGRLSTAVREFSKLYREVSVRFGPDGDRAGSIVMPGDRVSVGEKIAVDAVAMGGERYCPAGSIERIR